MNCVAVPAVMRRSVRALREDFPAGGVLQAQLHVADAGRDGGLGAGLCARAGPGDHQVEAEGVGGGPRMKRGARHGARSSAIRRAILRPLLSMPPKIGPMRKPPCTLFAAMPEA